jgi:hypothetical protein
MELLEAGGVRPRQARYQAALRPDMKCTTNSKALARLRLPQLVAIAPTVFHPILVDISST